MVTPWSQNQKRVDPFAGGDVTRASDVEVRDRALALFEQQRSRSLSSEQLDHVDRLIRSGDPDCRGDYIARRALITEQPAYKRGFAQVLSERPVLTGEEAEALRSL